MIRCNSFGRSLIFAAVAAAGWLPWVVAAAPIFGAWSARALYMIVVATLYVAGIAPRGAQRLAVMAVYGLLACGVAVAAHTPTELAIGLGVLLGIARAGFLYRFAPARAVVTEVVLVFGGLVFSRFLAGTSLLSTARAIWAFLLVQSCFFVVGGVRERRPFERQQPDPFEAAYQRALALLDRTGM